MEQDKQRQTYSALIGTAPRRVSSRFVTKVEAACAAANHANRSGGKSEFVVYVAERQRGATRPLFMYPSQARGRQRSALY